MPIDSMRRLVALITVVRDQAGDLMVKSAHLLTNVYQMNKRLARKERWNARDKKPDPGRSHTARP